MIRLSLILLVTALGAWGAESSPATADQILKELLAGNQRYAGQKATHPHQDPARRTALAKTQNPGAVILGCSDSRVGPEVVFDQGLGDLFVVRDAGNSANDVVVGSIEYALEHLGSKLVIVLGHERCGAISAALAGGEAHGHLAAVLDPLKAAVKIAKGSSGDQEDVAVRENAKVVAAQLRASKPVIAQMVADGKVKIVAARYDLDTGVVEILK